LERQAKSFCSFTADGLSRAVYKRKGGAFLEKTGCNVHRQREDGGVKDKR
jgi:hypothetical protein